MTRDEIDAQIEAALLHAATVRESVASGDDPAGPVMVPIRYGPGVAAWPTTAFSWCQRCDRAIVAGQPYMPRLPMLTGHRGFDHAWCPPVLTVVR